MVLQAVILAGGLGTRLRKEVPDRPKPMALIHDRPFLEYQLDYWIAQGVTHFVLSVGYMHQKIMEYFGSAYNGASIDYAIESRPMGTGGGLLCALDKVHEDAFLLLNGDTYFAVSFRSFYAFAQEKDADLCMALFPSQDAERYMGVDVMEDGQIASLKAQETQKEHWANGGVYWMKTEVLRALSHNKNQVISLESGLIPELLHRKKRLYGFKSEACFIDIGVPVDYHRAKELFEELV